MNYVVKKHKHYLWWLVPLVFVGGVAFDLRAFVVSGGSMEPSYHEGERVLVDTLLWHITGLQVGDVVVFRDPKLAIDIKRVSDTPAEAGTYYLLGDNRSHSTDSREWGSIPSSYILGRVVIDLH